MLSKATLLATVTLSLLAAAIPIVSMPGTDSTSTVTVDDYPVFDFEAFHMENAYLISKYQQKSKNKQHGNFIDLQKTDGILSATVRVRLLTLSRFLLLKHL